MTTLVDLLRSRAAAQRERLAYRFLVDGESREIVLTYAALDERARAIAAVLQSLQKAGDRTLLVYPPGLEFICAFFGSLYAGTVAIVVPAPHRGRVPQFLSKLAGIFRDATPSLALTTSAIQDALAAPDTQNIERRPDRWIVTDGVPVERGDDWRAVKLATEDLAFLQYTSGSTTEPKGVMVSHGNVMHNLGAIQEAFAQSAEAASVSWLPPFHDMGLVGGILAPLYVGSPATLLSPLAFVQSPRRWLQAISRFKAAVSGGPNFAYDLCVRKIAPDERASLDLRHWKVAFNGAEPVSATTLRQFAEYFQPCGFAANALRPCYGLAESTLLVSAARNRGASVRAFRTFDLARNEAVPCNEDDAAARMLPSAGAPAANVVIVDPAALKACPPGRIGEIWVSSPSVAMGYWNRAEETQHTFRARLDDTGAGPFLRTGDLGFLLGTDLFITGRLKDLIVIDGNNHYPQDIEKTVRLCHPDLRAADCAAFSVDAGGREALVVVAALDGRSSTFIEEVHGAIRAAISRQHNLRIHDIVLVQPGRIPKTASGKLRRQTCRADYLAQALDVRVPQ